MYRLSKIPEEHRPEIISDISDDKFYTFIVQGYYFNKIKRKDADDDSTVVTAAAFGFAFAAAVTTRAADAAAAWEGSYWHEGTFKTVIDKNIPCTLMHKVKNKWCPEIDTIVCLMTGDTRDVFLVHPKDLIEWDPNEEINH